MALSTNVNVKIKTAPLIVGGVYERIQRNGKVAQAMCVCIEDSDAPIKKGILRQYGYPEDYVIENDESLAGWDLIAVPNALDERIESENIDTPLLAQQKEIARLQAQNRELREALKNSGDEAA